MQISAAFNELREAETGYLTALATELGGELSASRPKSQGDTGASINYFVGE